MRKILFRAVAKGDLKTMVYGYYHYDSQTDTHYICLKDSLIRKEIDPYTLGQFTGLTDKNGKDVWENDIICNEKYQTWEWRGVVKFSHGLFGAEWFSNIKSQSMVGSWGQKHNLRKLDDDILERQIIIGNVHENPELL